MFPPVPEERAIPYLGENYNPQDADFFKRPLLPATWQPVNSSPSLRPPYSDAISVYKITELRLVKRPEDRGLLRRRLGTFTENPEGSEYAGLFRYHLELLRWPEPCTAIPGLFVNGKEGRIYHYIVPAFFRLLTWLTGQSEFDYAILIRTYGRDVPHILNAVRLYNEGLHPTELPGRPIPVGSRCWCLDRFDARPGFLYAPGECLPDGRFRPRQESGAEETMTRPRDIYETWCRLEGVHGVVDDFAYWHAHCYHHTAAKPHWIDPGDREHHHILFDDNIRFEADGSNVIDIQRLLPRGDGVVGETDVEADDCVRLTPDQAETWEGIFYVQNDLLAIIRDPDYFIKAIKDCIHKYTKLEPE
ncbi:unnamed protein product [Protopolystoma xenopodis]|uniref:Uncharacterized protein n=1 Tax=Protopolystoma xenopodis TaxID=117903 RepID=A0A3S5B1E4_9PLAT|nr:unnamed protein product [Protopolystoma xenopodis]